MTFDYCPTVGARPERCLYGQWRAMTEAPRTAELIAAYRSGDASAKRRLPAVAFMASFGGLKRAASAARPSGLVMADFDHLEPGEIDAAAARLVPATDEERATSPVMLVHRTPSGRGLRVVIKCTAAEPYAPCRTVADYQQVLAHVAGLDGRLDAACHDLSRLSFCPMAADVLYVSSRMWTEAPERLPEAVSQQPQPAPRLTLPAEAPAAPAAQQTYCGEPLRDIFERYFAMTGGLPHEGERNARFYAAARDLRYICDFRPEVLAAHMPDVGLTADEVMRVCRSACESSRATALPAAIRDALSVGADEPEPDEPVQAEPDERWARLPVLVRELVMLQPEAFRPAALLALLPIVGTLSTHVRARYLDGEIHSTSFLTIVMAEQASGKSFARKLVDTLLADIASEDAVSREAERAYRKSLRMLKNKTEQPEEPRVKVRLIPASVSVAKLLQRLDYAEGEHLFSFAEELDTVIKSNRAGAWSEKGDIYRNAFDNALYGQDFISDNSYSATLPVYYNMLFLGTPRQVTRFFPNVENGLVSRFCFATLPDQFGARMPHARQLSAEMAERVARWARLLRAARGVYDLSFVNEELDAWLEEQRQQALADADRARDIFRRRAAVIGFRAALSVAPLYSARNVPKTRARLSAFARLVADCVLKGQMDFAAERLNAALAPRERETRRSGLLLDALPERFTVSELTAELRRRGMRSPAKSLVYVWRREGLVASKKRGEYEKMHKQKSTNNHNNEPEEQQSVLPERGEELAVADSEHDKDAPAVAQEAS